MNAVTAMRSYINSMHIMHAVDCGVQLGLFQALAKGTQPISIDEYVRKVPYKEQYVKPWLHAVQTAGIIFIDSNKGISFVEGWQEALTDPNSSSYVPPMLKCHLAIERTYERFPAIFRGEYKMPLNSLDVDLMSSISADGSRFANYFLNHAINKIPNLEKQLKKGICVHDVGCGGGDFILKVADAYPQSHFVGIDKVGRAIDIAKKAMLAQNMDGRVEFKQMNAKQLQPRSADFIILNEVLHEMDPAERLDALIACRNCLKKGSYLFLTDILAPHEEVDYINEEYALSALVAFFESPWGSKLLTRSELSDLLRQAGFGSLNHIMTADNIVAAYVKPE